MDPDIVLSLTAWVFFFFFSPYGQVFGLMVVVLYCMAVSINLIRFNISKRLTHTVTKYVILC